MQLETAATDEIIGPDPHEAQDQAGVLPKQEYANNLIFHFRSSSD
jgi:hypothetical protein